MTLVSLLSWAVRAADGTRRLFCDAGADSRVCGEISCGLSIEVLFDLLVSGNPPTQMSKVGDMVLAVLSRGLVRILDEETEAHSKQNGARLQGWRKLKLEQKKVTPPRHF